MATRRGKLRVLVTGANGFIGSHVVRLLVRRNAYRVTGLVRRTSDLWRLEPVPVDLAFGDLDTPASTPLEGFDAVIHTSGKISDWGRYEDFERTNVEGTAGLLDAAVRSGVRRFVYLSSVAVYGFYGVPNTAEESPRRPFPNPYCTTKALAEERILENRHRLEVVVLRPSNVFGPRDTSFTLPLLKGLEKGLPAWPKGGKTLTSPCFVGNLARAVELAVATKDGVGEVFNVTDGADVPWKVFLDLFGRELGARTPRFPMPAAPLFGLSIVMERLYRAFGSRRPPLITPYRIAQSTRDYSFSVDKAKRLLGYEPPFTTEEGVRESVRWYRDRGETPPAGLAPPPR